MYNYRKHSECTKLTDERHAEDYHVSLIPDFLVLITRPVPSNLSRSGLVLSPNTISGSHVTAKAISACAGHAPSQLTMQ